MKIMFDNPKELLDKVRLGEIMFLEFKEVRFAGGKAEALTGIRSPMDSPPLQIAAEECSSLGLETKPTRSSAFLRTALM